MGNYSMPRYFQNMPVVGKAVRPNPENVEELKAIEDDIDEQTSSDAFEPEYEYLYDDWGRFSFRLKNNTEYTYSTVFDFRFLTEENNLFYSDSVAIENIRPGESYTVSVDIDLKDCDTEGLNWEWENYYTSFQW